MELAVAAALVVALPVSGAAEQLRFTASEGTWISLDADPGGQRLVFELLGDLYRLPVEGGQAVALTRGAAFESQPRYSPDGRELVYISDESGSDNVWIATAEGEAPRQLTNRSRALMFSPAWSADGGSIYVSVIDGAPRQSEIWRFDVTTGEGARLIENEAGRPAPLVSSPAPGAYGPAPSPDGASLYYTSVTPRPYGSRSGASAAIFRYDLAEQRRESVSVDGVLPMRPWLSRDGRLLAYAAERNGRTGLRIRTLESGQERWLIYPMDRHQLEGRATRDVVPGFAFSADDRTLVLGARGKIRRVAIEGGPAEIIDFQAEVTLEIQPRLHTPQRIDTEFVTARRIQQIAFGPDGMVAVSALGRIWLADKGDGEFRRLTASDAAREFMPAISPDGSQVAFVSWGLEGGGLWVAPTRGGAARRVSATAAKWLDPVWSGDGTSIVALSVPLASARRASARPSLQSPQDARLLEVSVADGTAMDLGAARGARRPQFIRSSERLFLSAGAQLVSVARDGSDRRVEATASRAIGVIDWHLSPDGSAVALRTRTGIRVFRGLQELADGAEIGAEDGVIHPVPAALGGPGASAVAFLRSGEPRWVVGNRLEGAGGTTRSLRIRVARPRGQESLVLRGARVLTMNGSEILERADVWVQGRRIAGVGAHGELEVPESAEVIDVTGKTIVPGYIDVHAHFPIASELLEPDSSDMAANLAFGVTTLRNPQAGADVFALADAIDAEAVAAPRVFSTGPGLLLGFGGGHYAAPGFGAAVDAHELLERYRNDYGTRLIKSYLVGNRQERQWVIEAGRDLGMMPTTEGGADTKAGLTYAIDGFTGTEHALPVAQIYDDVVQLFAHSGITYCPTLVVSFGGALPIYRLLAEERPHTEPQLTRWYAEGEIYERSSRRLLSFPAEAFNDREVAAGAAAIMAAGGRVAIGGHGEMQGLSTHWEMELLEGGGMSAHDVLRAATWYGAETMGLEGELGSIEPGKLADLVVLDRNPLDDLRNARAVRFVMKDGLLFDGHSLDQRWPERRDRARAWWSPEGARLTSIENHVRRRMAEGGVPGVGVAIIDRGEVVLAKGFGVANLEQGTPVSTRTMFQSGSVGKMFTAAGIMALVEEGRLDLDAPIREVLPELPPTWQPITVRHLLTHSAGIPDYTSNTFDYTHNYSDAELVRMAGALDLEFPAGTRWNYSNTGYVLLGLMITRITDSPYWDWLRERIFDPAQMPTARINTEPDIVPHRARGYLPSPRGWSHAGWVAPRLNQTADGALLFSLEDMLAWHQTVRGRSVLESSSWQAMLSPMTLNSGARYPYGFGWMMDETPGGTVNEHGGAWQGFTAHYAHHADRDLGVVVLANARSLVTSALAGEVAALWDPRLEVSSAPTEPIEDPNPSITAEIARLLAKASSPGLELADFSFVRQTLFPRIRSSLRQSLSGLGAPDRLELLATETLGDDRVREYFAYWGDRRFRVRAQLAMDGGLTGLRVREDFP